MRSIAGAILVATSAFLFILRKRWRGGADTIGGVVALGLPITDSTSSQAIPSQRPRITALYRKFSKFFQPRPHPALRQVCGFEGTVHKFSLDTLQPVSPPGMAKPSIDYHLSVGRLRGARLRHEANLSVGSVARRVAIVPPSMATNSGVGQA